MRIKDRGERTKKLTATVPISMYEEIEAIAEEDDRSMGYIVKHFLSEKLQERRKSPVHYVATNEAELEQAV